VRLAEAPSHGKPALLYDIRSRGAEAYIRLAKEIMTRSLAAPVVMAPAAAEEATPETQATEVAEQVDGQAAEVADAAVAVEAAAEAVAEGNGEAGTPEVVAEAAEVAQDAVVASD
jgi:chromosome partitioning protein